MAFKMAGWSAFTKETNLPEEEQQKITDKKDALAKEAWDKYGVAPEGMEKLSWEEKKKRRKNNPRSYDDDIVNEDGTVKPVEEK